MKFVDLSAYFVENAGKPAGDRPGHRYSNNRCWSCGGTSSPRCP
jgi:hypothetical protein